ncbi:ABC transporter substrate-binding protein [Paenibacillus paeoniae]|uniref:ABC transporter substrate-binding protein n=1 Tax=Paenibacillus paeoniae TaxID=2292705 RepID=A0A371PIH2_9BACL|nr:ABC transporter substrate-binding protein [Paenibacillus paeoniae]REK75170.1 ABC transporter substrate-binding protein [Paenibacillus paeoniae]
MVKRLIILLGTVVLAVILAACSSSSNTKEGTSAIEGDKGSSATKVVTDLFGEVTIPAEPKNLFVTSSTYAEYLIEMGIKPKYVLVVPELEPAYRASYFEENGVEMIPTAQYIYNFEQILSLAPDMIIVPGGGLEATAYEGLSKTAPTVALKGSNAMHSEMHELAILFDKKEEANKILAAFDEKAKAAKEKIAEAIGDKSVLVLRVEPERYRYLGPKADDEISRFFYETLGLKSPEIFKDSTDWFTPFSLEILPDIKADYIFLEKRAMENYDSTDSLKQLEGNSLWRNMAAVKNKHVFPLNTNDYVQAKGPIGTSLLIDYIVEKLVS